MDAKNIRSIVMATDLTEGSDRVIRAAASIAALTGAELHVLHVHVVPAVPNAAWVTGATPNTAAVQQAERELEGQIRRATPSWFTPADRAVVTDPSPSEAIRRYVEEASADLVVLGPHRGSATDRPFLGTTADRLVRTAGVPCLIVRRTVDFPVRRIGVLTDFSPAAQAAQNTAAAWMEAFSGGAPPGADPDTRPQICVAHIAPPEEGSDREALEATEIRPELRKLIERSAARADPSSGVEYVPEVLWARNDTDAVADWVRAHGLAMIVLGTQGISRLPYPYLGSLASKVARTAPCSVLLVPPGYTPASARGEPEGEVRVQRVVTGVDFHESSWKAALWAMRYFAPDAEYELLHVIEATELPGPLRGLGSGREQLRLAARNDAQRRLQELTDLEVCPRVGTHLQEGKPATEIVRLAEEVGADLVLVGEQGPTRGVAALLGSTAERVLYASKIPVLIARKVVDAPPRRFLVAIDPSEVSGRLLAWAGALLARFDATATVLNVVDRVLLSDELSGLPTAKAFQRLETEATTAMQGWLDGKVREAGLPPSRVRATVLTGDPSYEIISEAARQGADLVLVGSKGGDIARTPLIGRIVNKVVRSAPCSVLVVTPREAE